MTMMWRRFLRRTPLARAPCLSWLWATRRLRTGCGRSGPAVVCDSMPCPVRTTERRAVLSSSVMWHHDLCSQQRQRQRTRGADTTCTAQGNRAPMGGKNLLDHVHSQPGAVRFRGMKRLKYLWQFVLRNATAGVLHCEVDLRPYLPTAERQRATLGHSIDGVLYQIDEHAVKSIAMRGPLLQVFQALHVQGDTTLCAPLLELESTGVHDGVEIFGLAAEIRQAR